MEIEKAIEKLGSNEFAELSSWWEDFLARKSNARSEDKLEAIRRTSGCLGGENGESFENAVTEAGHGIKETHEW